MLQFSRWKILSIWAVVLVAFLYAMPNFISSEWRDRLPSFLPKSTVVLGLDLQGGSHMLLAVDADDVLKNRTQTLLDEVRQTLRNQKIGYTSLGLVNPMAGAPGVQVRIRETTQIEKALVELKKLSTPVSTSVRASGENELNIEDRGEGLIVLTLTTGGVKDRIIKAVEQSLEIVRRRVDQLGTTEPIIQRQGTDRILVQVPGLMEPTRLKELLGQTAKLTFRMVDTTNAVDQAQAGRVPPEAELLFNTDAASPQPVLIEKRVIISGEDLIDAQAGFDSRTGEPVVNFRFSGAGSQRFARATQENIGRPFAIVLDNKVISAPVIREPILGGSGQISGGFTVERAKDLALLLRAGALPAKLTVIEERTVGPGLGQDSIEAGKTATLIGAVFVVLFMIAIYGLLGVFANIAVFFNIIMIFALLSVIGATLTLPGIAGILLTLGMAVDSNVLIYERIREEVRLGRSAISAIDAGFEKALGTILDANITTLIAAIVLFYIGTGPVRGFALTLAVGIFTTMFTAFTVTRLIVVIWLRFFRPTAFKL